MGGIIVGDRHLPKDRDEFPDDGFDLNRSLEQNGIAVGDKIPIGVPLFLFTRRTWFGLGAALVVLLIGIAITTE